MFFLPDEAKVKLNLVVNLAFLNQVLFNLLINLELDQFCFTANISDNCCLVIIIAVNSETIIPNTPNINKLISNENGSIVNEYKGILK
uniref:Uncharacterized protein n=1 Tax=Mycoplasma feriruminatoris TaxID=1179777 RepID=A0A654IKF4_9MOLU|nr:hypothetical protein MF5295_00509 [Mycoplasma feriruminatoris]